MQTVDKESGKQALELGRSMSEFKNHVRKHIQVKIKEHGINLTFEMLEVMGCLWKKDGVNQQEIADLTLRDKSSMTYLLDNLVKRKMVKRIEDDNDRRNKLIFLTDEGMCLKEQLNPWVEEVYTKAAKGLSKFEVESSVILINKMICNVKT
jgi:DNA-binding MarR family transcriptional regulator